MQLKEFDIILDVKKSYKTEEFEVVQGDSYSNVLNITLTNGLNPFTLTNTNVEIVFSKSDGATVQQTDAAILNASQGRIQCILKTNTIASPGKVIAEVRVLENEILLTSTRFEFFVRKSLINDETIESTNEFPVLTQLISTTEGLITQVNQIEKQVPEQVITDLDEVRTRVGPLANLITRVKTSIVNALNGIQEDVNEHKAESASKHIKESGTNENGRYIKFDDGTLICTREVNADLGLLSQQFAFPASSIVNMATSYSMNVGTSSADTVRKRSNCYTRGTTNAWTLFTLKEDVEGTMISVSLLAIGRWK